MTGWEPKFDPRLWNDKKQHRETHNCFAYAMNILDPKQIRDCLASKECNLPFHQPGVVGGYKGFNSVTPKTCPDMIGRIVGDNPSIRPITFEEKCPDQTSKIALVVDEDEDYHFLRQDSNGWWSQKGGAKPVTNLDAGRRPIWDPALSDSNWTNSLGPLNYDVFCGYLCVPRVAPLKIRTGGGRRKTRRLREKRRVVKRVSQPMSFRIFQKTRSQGRKA
jgi:hypothetical protein